MKIASEINNDYKESKYTESNVIYKYEYKDTILIKEITTINKKDSTKTIYKYNNINLLKEKLFYNYKRRIREGVNKGIASLDGCLLLDEDYEKERSWKLEERIIYTYDSNNRKTESYDPFYNNSHNKYTWSYNTLGKIDEQRYYSNNSLYSIKKYKYSELNYQYTLTTYEYDGTPTHLKKDRYDWQVQLTYFFDLDSQGRVIKETVTTDKNELRRFIVTKYNKNNLIEKRVRYNKFSQPEMTHIYTYNE